MKIKNKIYLVVAMFFFLGITFVGISMADDLTYSECINDYGGTPEDCAGYPGDPNVPVYDNYNNNCSGDYSTEICCQKNGGYWYNNTCNSVQSVNTDCPMPNTYFENSINDCACIKGFSYDSTEGVCTSDSAPSITCQSHEHLSGGECVCDGGYSYDSTEGVCTSDQNVKECITDESCTQKFGKGYKCIADICMVDGFWADTECMTDKDCARLFPNDDLVCTGIFVSTCEARPTPSTSTTSETPSSGGSTTNTTTQAVKTNTQLVDSAGKTYPAGTSINTTTGQATLPSGTIAQLPPADLQAVNSSVNSGSGFTLCANGIMGQICETNRSSGAPLTVINNGTSNNRGLGNVAGLSGATTPKCATNFKDIGGVCFPTNTGLSDAPIYLILSNIFSWLMGLFTTLAIGAFVLSGVQYTTAAGSDDQMKTAKNNAKYALIGIIVGLSGFIVLQAVSAALSGSKGYFF
ncbi:MAG: hypothetical protein ACD_56C00039G0007 [uncultured bacterium]|nr:MAG: hypothetical protein ACD_56C00039G0007 [uncultured bacterium]